MAQGVTHAVGTSRPVIVASAPDGVDEMLIFFSSPARDGRAATQRRGERHDSQKTHLLILPKPGGIQSQPKGEINSNCTKIVNSRTHGTAAYRSIGYIPLAESESDQARAQQHKAGCGQCEEPVRDNVVVAHVTPATFATLDARPN